ATVIFPAVKRMYTEDGEAGRTKFIAISRTITIPLAVLQAVAYLSLLETQGVIGGLTSFQFAVNVFLVSAGSMLLMWIGELITEFALGTGVSLMIFAAIMSRIPAGISQVLYTASASTIPAMLGFAVLGLAAVYAVVTVSEAERSIPIAYARQVRGAAMQGG